MPTSIGDWFLFKEKEVKKLRKQKNLKLIAATGVTIFSLFAAVTGAFAWFTSLLDFSNSVDGFNVFHDRLPSFNTFRSDTSLTDSVIF